jgi:hypothetical protein
MIAGLALGIVIAAFAFTGALITWRHYGALALGARGVLAACPEVLEMRYRIVEHGGRDGGNAGNGKVVSLPVRPRLAPLHPALARSALRAAA